MELQRDDSIALDRRVGFAVIDGFESVDPELDVISLGADDVVVPPFLLQDRVEFRRGLHKYLIAPSFIVEAAPVFLAHVGLIPGDMARYFLAAELNAAVPYPSDEVKRETQLEIAKGSGRAEEVVVFDASRASDNHPVFHQPQRSVAFPAGEIFSIE